MGVRSHEPRKYRPVRHDKLDCYYWQEWGYWGPWSWTPGSWKGMNISPRETVEASEEALREFLKKKTEQERKSQERVRHYDRNGVLTDSREVS